MPNKTIYLKDADVPIFERAQQDLGESVSALFAEFLRQRLTNQTEPEKKAMEFLRQIRRDRKALMKEGAAPNVLRKYEDAEAFGEKVWHHLKNKDFAAARTLWFGAHA